VLGQSLAIHWTASFACFDQYIVQFANRFAGQPFPKSITSSHLSPDRRKILAARQVVLDSDGTSSPGIGQLFASHEEECCGSESEICVICEIETR